MANFCKQCSIDNFGQDHGDLRGITSEEDWEAGLAKIVICEDCGIIQVDPEGNCVSPDCLYEGQPGHGLPWKGESA